MKQTKKTHPRSHRQDNAKKHCYSCKITNCVLHPRAFFFGVLADWKTKKTGLPALSNLLRFQNGMNFILRWSGHLGCEFKQHDNSRVKIVARLSNLPRRRSWWRQKPPTDLHIWHWKTVGQLKFGFIKGVAKGWITTVKDLDCWRFER